MLADRLSFAAFCFLAGMSGGIMYAHADPGLLIRNPVWWLAITGTMFIVIAVFMALTEDE
jgi:tellurite resistance protein TehA-like permease